MYNIFYKCMYNITKDSETNRDTESLRDTTSRNE